MTMKRKFDLDADDYAPNNAKQLKLIPFPNYEPDIDANMFDVEPTLPYHTRLVSSVSSSSTSSSDSPTSPESSLYPPFDIYPNPFFTCDGTVDPSSHVYSSYSAQSSPSQAVRLLQPSSDFSHHGIGCSQIPKLRLSCSASPDGRRTMWSHCEQCGAISMVDNFD